MERQKAKAVLEAVLFTMGESVEIDRLSEVIEEDKEATKAMLDEMAEEYRKEGRGIELTTLENAVQLCTKGEFYEYLVKIATTPKKFVLEDLPELNPVQIEEFKLQAESEIEQQLQLDI